MGANNVSFEEESALQMFSEEGKTCQVKNVKFLFIKKLHRTPLRKSAH